MAAEEQVVAEGPFSFTEKEKFDILYTNAEGVQYSGAGKKGLAIHQLYDDEKDIQELSSHILQQAIGNGSEKLKKLFRKKTEYEAEKRRAPAKHQLLNHFLGLTKHGAKPKKEGKDAADKWTADRIYHKLTLDRLLKHWKTRHDTNVTQKNTEFEAQLLQKLREHEILDALNFIDGKKVLLDVISYDHTIPRADATDVALANLAPVYPKNPCNMPEDHKEFMCYLAAKDFPFAWISNSHKITGSASMFFPELKTIVSEIKNVEAVKGTAKVEVPIISASNVQLDPLNVFGTQKALIVPAGHLLIVHQNLAHVPLDKMLSAFPKEHMWVCCFRLRQLDEDEPAAAAAEPAATKKRKPADETGGAASKRPLATRDAFDRNAHDVFVDGSRVIDLTRDGQAASLVDSMHMHTFRSDDAEVQALKKLIKSLEKELKSEDLHDVQRHSIEDHIKMLKGALHEAEKKQED